MNRNTKHTHTALFQGCLSASAEQTGLEQHGYCKAIGAGFILAGVLFAQSTSAQTTVTPNGAAVPVAGLFDPALPATSPRVTAQSILDTPESFIFQVGGPRVQDIADLFDPDTAANMAGNLTVGPGANWLVSLNAIAMNSINNNGESVTISGLVKHIIPPDPHGQFGTTVNFTAILRADSRQEELQIPGVGQYFSVAPNHTLSATFDVIHPQPGHIDRYTFNLSETPHPNGGGNINGWQLQIEGVHMVPAPSSVALLSLGSAVAIRRRRA